MNVFPPVTDPSSHEGLQALYDEITATGFGSGTPLNWFTSQGSRPDILAATWGLVKALLVSGELPGTVKQMIVVTISSRTECRYCAVVHTGALEAMGVPREVVESCVQDPEMAQIPEQHRAILQFALKAADDATSIGEADVEGLRNHGLSDEQIMEVVMMAGFTNFITAWAEISGIPVDGE